MQPKPWIPATLRLAGFYNLIWGTWVILFPGAYFAWVDMPPPNYPQLWQCIGMVVGVYGIGYFIAATDPRRHWPIVLVGLLGKIFGPIGFAIALLRGELPLAFAWTLLTNDLIWWVPFSLILLDAATAAEAPQRHGEDVQISETAIFQLKVDSGDETILDAEIPGKGEHD